MAVGVVTVVVVVAVVYAIAASEHQPLQQLEREVRGAAAHFPTWRAAGGDDLMGWDGMRSERKRSQAKLTGSDAALKGEVQLRQSKTRVEVRFGSVRGSVRASPLAEQREQPALHCEVR